MISLTYKTAFRILNSQKESSYQFNSIVYDNIFVKRLWRTVKYEEVFLHQYPMVSDARRSLDKYFLFYNMERIHESLGYRTPYEIYVKERLDPKPVQANTIHQIQPVFLY